MAFNSLKGAWDLQRSRTTAQVSHFKRYAHTTYKFVEIKLEYFS